MEFCVPGNGAQDLENARRTARTMTLSGTWNPTVDPTSAIPGALFLGLSKKAEEGTGGRAWIKQYPAGCDTNWLEIPLAGASGGLLFGWPVIAPLDDDGDVKDAIETALSAPATTVVNARVTGDEVQDAINAANDGDVIEVQHNGPYNPITLPMGKSLTIRAHEAYVPVLTGQNCIKIADNATGHRVVGPFLVQNATTISANTMGSGISMAADGAQCSDMIFSGIEFSDCAGSAIGISKHIAAYQTPYGFDDLQDNFSVVDCRFFDACSDTIEGASILVRGARDLLIRRCHFHNIEHRTRATNIMAALDTVIEGCTSIGHDQEAFKFNSIALPAAVFSNTGVIRRCLADDARSGAGTGEGFNPDDSSVIDIESCIARNCDLGFRYQKTTSGGTILNSLAYQCVLGFQFSTVVPINAAALDNAVATHCDTDFDMANGYVVPTSCLEGSRAALIPFARDPNAQLLVVDTHAPGNDEPDGSFDKPYHSFAAACERIDKAGDNVVNTRPYCLLFLGDGDIDEVFDFDPYTNIQDIELISLGHTRVNPAAGTHSLRWTTNNAGVRRFNCTGFQFVKEVEIACDTNGGNNFDNDQNFISCIFSQKVTMKSMVVADFIHCKINANLEVENITIGIISGGEGQGPFQLDVNDNGANPRPAGQTNTYFIIEKSLTLATTVNIQANATLQLREGVRYQHGGATTNIDGLLLAYTAWLRTATINVNATGTLQLEGALYNPDVTTIAGAGTVTNNTNVEAMRYTPSVPGDWTPVPADPRAALDQLAAAVHPGSGGMMFTAIGGLAIQRINRTGAATVRGMGVKADPTPNDDSVVLTAVDDTECIGTFLEDGTADGQSAWVVVSGIADCLFEPAHSPNGGDWVKTGNATAGLFFSQASPAAAPTHFEETGHCNQSVVSGGGSVLARCFLHFN